MSNEAVARLARRRTAMVAASLAIIGLAPAARADENAAPSRLAPIQLAQANQSVSSTPEAASAPPQVNPFGPFENLRVKGWNINVAGPADTVDRDAFGIRSALADKGIGYLLYTNDFFADNLLRHAHPLNNSRANQVYSGQLPTYLASGFGFLTYDLSQYGVPDGQIVIGGTVLNTNWEPLGPRTASLGTASYYQTFFNKTLELKVGYFANGIEFLGTYVGGNLASGVFGPNASIPVEQGQNSLVFATPGINVKLNLPGNFYDKFGVQRAISPDGSVVENQQNPSAASFTVRNAGAFIINEAGYRVAAAPGQNQTWIRAAASYTTSNYQNFDRPGTRSNHNYGVFLLADRQLVQTGGSTGYAAQGIYAGASFMYAPPALNRFSQYYEGRLYGLGLIPGRPLDLISLVATSNVFSTNLVQATKAAGRRAHSSSEAYTASYSAHVYPGVNLNFGVSYIDNPTPIAFNGNTGSGLNLLIGTVTFF